MANYRGSYFKVYYQMENTGTFNSDLLVIFIACFFVPMFISSLFNIYIKFKNIKEGRSEPKDWWDKHDIFGFPTTSKSITKTRIDFIKPEKTNRTPKKRDLPNRDDGKPETRHLKRNPIVSKTKEDAWLEIQQKAIEQAINGDSGARAWVTKNVYNAQKSPKSKLSKDAVSALMQLGFSKPEAQSRISDLTSSKDYTSIDDLIKDSIKS